eukprot:364693-Chlamydomonas_euryale.AAC.9
MMMTWQHCFLSAGVRNVLDLPSGGHRTSASDPGTLCFTGARLSHSTGVRWQASLVLKAGDLDDISYISLDA